MVLLAGCSGGSEEPGDDGRSPASGAPTTYPASTAPATIPAVRDFESARGPGWKPGRDSRVVADPDGPLADEARTVAGELGLEAAAGPAREGDLELAIDKDRKGGSEAYRITTGDGRVRITGAGDAGVFYGTRTVLQALRSGDRVPEGVIDDRPDRPQRGFMLDIARKHFTAGWIEDRIREIADLKYNQLGLHFSDDQGFRIESDSHPEVVSEQHLTKKELRRILDLAERLHVTVIPEIDSPGHLGAVMRAHPGLQLRNAEGTPARGAVNIADPRAAKIVDELLREFAGEFPGRWFHVGADEYRALMAEDPEAAYPDLAAAARRAHGSGARVQDLATQWLNDRAEVVRKADKQPKAWNDGFFEGGSVQPGRDIEVEYWTGKEIGARKPADYLREGRKVVNLNDEYLYYVLGEPNDFTYPTGERIYRDWTPAVLRGTEPVPANLATRDKVLGGRFAVWCDLAGAQTQAQVADGIRMPLRALAQKLWDPRDPSADWKAFRGLADRLDEKG
ncbi:glycoside hydrolase family 20 protein [Streptomyces sp. NPDC048845]|uniref:beta-N-acetylhexosaminidase n=1 Tax=Streptomyces sp. NPDC048845 TaxID=3155390 RepID=UPI0034436E07